MLDEILEQDEHIVPTQLGERVPALPFLWPLDWTLRQMYWMTIGFWLGAQQLPEAHQPSDWLSVGGYIALGLLGVIVEYNVRPTPEFWLLGWLEYLGVLVLSLPLWWRRLLPAHGPRAWWYARRHGLKLPPTTDGARTWPLATLPLWLGRRLVANAEVLGDGVLRTPGLLGRRAHFAVAIGIRPRPHPDLLPLLLRQSLIAERLGVFRRIRGRWSIHLQVRAFDVQALERASGPAWGWVAEHMAPRLVVRRPSLVLYGDRSEELATQAEAIVERFRQVSVVAWRQTATEARRLKGELWSDMGFGSGQRVRIGQNRVIAGYRTYRSWALLELPRIIHLAWLRPLTSEALLCDLAIHVQTRPPGATRRSLQRRVRRWRAVDTDDDYALATSDAKRVLNAMRRNVDTEVKVGVYVTCRDEQATQVAEALETAQCEFRPARVMQHRALRATRTLGGDPFGRTMQADLRTVATTDLMATAGYWPDGATLIGESLSAPEPIGVNLLDPANLSWSMFIAVMSGGGKTTLAHTLAWRMANPHPAHPLAQAGVQVVSVDFKASGDYEPLYRHLAARGHRASYNAWSHGPLPPLEGHLGFNLSDVPEDERGDKLLELAQRIEEWSAAHALERPMLLLLDEVLALLEARGGPSFLRRYGTQGRSLNVCPVFMTQDVESVLANRKAALAFKNCSHLFLGRANPAGIHAMKDLISLDEEAQVLLAGAPKGAGLLRIERNDGPVILGVQVRPTDWELREFGTNPAERALRWRRDQMEAHHRNGKGDAHAVPGLPGHRVLAAAGGPAGVEAE